MLAMNRNNSDSVVTSSNKAMAVKTFCCDANAEENAYTHSLLYEQ